MKETARQFVRFVVVGCVCTMTDMILFYVLRLFMPYQPAMIAGYLTSLTVNYLLTVYWTFSTEASVRNLVGIVMVHLFNLFVVRMGLMYVFVRLLAMDDRVAFVPTLVISSVASFFLVRMVVIHSS